MLQLADQLANQLLGHVAGHGCDTVFCGLVDLPGLLRFQERDLLERVEPGRRDRLSGRIFRQQIEHPTGLDVADDRGQFGEAGRQRFVQLIGQTSALFRLTLQP